MDKGFISKRIMSFIIIICVSISVLFGFSGCLTMSKRKYSRDLIAAIEANDMEKLQALVDKGGDLDISPSSSLDDNKEYPPLCFAARRGNYEAVKILVDAGADVNIVYCKNSYNYTPLSLVFLYGGYSDRNIETAKYLIENGADIGHKTRFGDTVLSRFILISYTDENKGSFEFFLYLLDKGAKLEEGPDGHIVFGACRDECVDFLKYLFENYEINVNMRSKTANQSTLLMQTTLYSGEPNACEFLLNQGADKTLQNSDGRTAYDLAMECYQFAAESRNAEKIGAFKRIIALLED